ncbi:MAG TPA: hypothetical protein DCY61_01230, partial [Dehalococcoidia bacterium]|nr:hypothetical protein [Dehalococcoidia bacterium]
SRAARGQRIALGDCEEKNYRTIAAVCISDGHVAIAKTPVDFNLAKQLNALLADIGVPSDSIIMDPDTAALGYGLEYGYSTMECLRLAALMGDAMCVRPIISQAGPENRHQKESRADRGVPAAWGTRQSEPSSEKHLPLQPASMPVPTWSLCVIQEQWSWLHSLSAN